MHLLKYNILLTFKIFYDQSPRLNQIPLFLKLSLLITFGFTKLPLLFLMVTNPFLTSFVSTIIWQPLI